MVAELACYTRTFQVVLYLSKKVGVQEEITRLEIFEFNK